MHTVNGVWYYMSNIQKNCLFVLSNVNYKITKATQLLNDLNIKF